jgi:dihydroorotase-like cyclic amidohydrolase
VSTADNYETGSRSAICSGTTTMITFSALEEELTNLF